MSRLISFVFAESSCEACKESENYKMKKILSTVELDPNTTAYKTVALTNCIIELGNGIHMLVNFILKWSPITKGFKSTDELSLCMIVPNNAIQHRREGNLIVLYQYLDRISFVTISNARSKKLNRNIKSMTSKKPVGSLFCITWSVSTKSPD